MTRAFRIIKNLILDCSDHTDPVAAKQLDEIRDRLEQLRVSSISRIRRAQHYLPELAEGNTPVWFERFKSAASETDQRLVESTEKLVRILSKHTEIEGECDLSDDGSIEITWDLPETFKWVVSKPEYSWPMINVTVYKQKQPGSPALESSTFMLAHRLIEYSEFVLISNQHRVKR